MLHFSKNGRFGGIHVSQTHLVEMMVCESRGMNACCPNDCNSSMNRNLPSLGLSQQPPVLKFCAPTSYRGLAIITRTGNEEYDRITVSIVETDK